jgi:hypothetical protein
MVPSMRGRLGWAVAGFVLAIAATSGAASNSAIRDCRQACKADYQDAITDPSECFNCATVACDPSCDGQLSDATDGQDSCLSCLMASGNCSDIEPNPGNPDQSFFTFCTNQCASPKPGVCAQNLTCVRSCREQLFFKQQRCRQRFQNQVRSVCRQVMCGSDVNYFRTAKQQLRQCRRACKTNPEAVVARAAPRGESAPAVPLETAPPAGCGCQQQCIRRIAGNCYSQCQNACRGDQDALNLCQQACRNAQCAPLRSACASDAASPAHAYAACCSQCADSSGVSCSASDQTAEEICTPTTTTTTTTSTSTSTSSTVVTTTTFAGQQTTSTTIISTTTTTLI